MYNIFFKRFIVGLLPVALWGNVAELLFVLSKPFRNLHERFMMYRHNKLWQLGYNWTVGSMEAMLNDYYADILAANANGRRILIVAGVADTGVWIYPEAEHLPVELGFVMLTSHTQWGIAPFVVRIPNELDGDMDTLNGVNRWVNEYKIMGTKHIIEYYE